MISVFETVDEERYQTTAERAPATQRHLAVNLCEFVADLAETNAFSPQTVSLVPIAVVQTYQIQYTEFIWVGN